MSPRNVLRAGAVTLMVLGVVLVTRTGAVAVALGVVDGGAVAGSSDPVSLAFWLQLSFIRLFGVSLMGLGAILMWCQAVLSGDQRASLARVLAGVLAALALMAAGQQVAIWNSPAGWMLTGSLASVFVACVAAVSGRAREHVVNAVEGALR